MAFPKNVYGFIALTGGGQGALDKIDGANLDDQDIAIGIAEGIFRQYSFDIDSGLAESSPDVIKPDANANDGRWILKYSKQIAQNVDIVDAGGYWDVSNVENVIAAIGNWATNRISKGWYNGGTVTCDAGALTVDVTSGTGNWGGTRNVSWDAASNVSITADSLNYIYVDTADSTVKSTTTRATADAEIPLAMVLANATEAIKVSPYRVGIADFHFKLHQYLKFVIGPVCENGMSVSINTPADLNIVVDTGAFHWGLFHFDYTTESPCSFTYWHKVTTTGVTRWVKTTAQTSINNTKYNLNTAGDWSYADLESNKYRKDLVCAAPKSDGTINIAVILGQDQFNSISAAREGAIPVLGDLEKMGFAALAYIIIKQGASSIAEVGDMRPLLGQYGAMQDHGSLTGLGDDDHPQYILKASPQLGGNLDANNHSINNLSAYERSNISTYQGSEVKVNNIILKTDTVDLLRLDNVGTIDWTDLDINTAGSGLVPAKANGVILVGYFWDSGTVTLDKGLSVRKKGETGNRQKFDIRQTNSTNYTTSFILVGLDSNGYIQYRVDATGADTASIFLRLFGWIEPA